MKKTVTMGMLLAVLVLMLSGCAELFTFNLFDGLEQINTVNTVEKATDPDKSDAENLDEIESLVESDDFTDALAEDEENGGTAKQDLLDYLDDVATDPEAEQEDVQDALALKADVYTKTTGGDDMVNNIAEIFTDPTVFEEMTDPSELLTTILPEDVETTEDLAALFLGLSDANDAYESLGDTLNPDNEDSLEADLNLGDIAQTALVANIVATAIDDIAAENGISEEEAAAELAEVILKGEDATTLFSDSFDVFSGMEEDTGVYNILMMSGLESLFA